MRMSGSSRARRVAAAVAIGLAIAASSSPSLAEPNASEKETARSLVASGREKRRAGDTQGALEDFQRAHAIMGVPTTALELGKTQASLGMLVEARATLLEGVRYPVHTSEPEAFKKARREARSLAESIAPRLATVTIAVSGAEGTSPKVSIDGAPASGSAVGVPLKLNPGKRVIIVKVGDEEKKAELDLAEGAEERVRFGFSAAATQKAIVDAPPKRAEPEATPSRTSPLVYVGIATAGLGVAVGTVTGIMSIGAYNSVKDDCPGGRCPPATHSDVDRGVTLGTISTISFVLAGVGAALIVVGIVAPSKSTVSVAVGPGGLGGRF